LIKVLYMTDIWLFFAMMGTWEWVKPPCGDIMDAAIISPFYRLTPDPLVSPHSCFSSKRDQLGCLKTLDTRYLFCCLISSFFVKSQE
jgi:hypothetical protein